MDAERPTMRYDAERRNESGRRCRAGFAREIVAFAGSLRNGKRVGIPLEERAILSHATGCIYPAAVV